jgi:hypothetical protein
MVEGVVDRLLLAPVPLQYTHQLLQSPQSTCPTCQCQERPQRNRPSRALCNTPKLGEVCSTSTRSTQLLRTNALHPENPLPSTLLATLVVAQHARPFQTLPMLFPPILLFSSYLNINGFKTDSAGLTSAWSAAYLVLAGRRKQAFGSKFGARGLVRGATVGLCVANVLGGGLAYAFGKRETDDA